jgi:exodeoxyribonuclease V alpha subunit
MDKLRGCENVQILGVTKRGSSGVENINSMLHNIHLMSASPPPKKLAGWDLAEGDPIIYLANDYERELWNGTLGRIKEVCVVTAPSSDKVHSTRSLLCDFDGVEHGLTDSDLHNLALAYAVTVHKAQGSQFRRIVMPVSQSRLLDRTLVYTALTRGIEQVVFVGERRAFERAVVAPPLASQRQVGFML